MRPFRRFEHHKRRKKRRQKLTEAERLQGFQRVRIGDLTQIFGCRYGGGKLYQLPDDDAGHGDLHILLDHYAYSNPLAMSRVVKARAPWMTDAERNDLLDDVNRFPRRWTAQALADALNLTEAERTDLKVRTIGSVDVTPRERKRLSKLRKRERDRERRRIRRRDDGSRTRAQYLADVKSTEPWLAAGMRRATYYLRRKIAASETVGLGASPIKFSNASDSPSPKEQAEVPKVRWGKEIVEQQVASYRRVQPAELSNPSPSNASGRKW